jgi:hypothetical protein
MSLGMLCAVTDTWYAVDKGQGSGVKPDGTYRYH